jgi:photosystem II stability/assembly factor-like uncharacterized protein
MANKRTLWRMVYAFTNMGAKTYAGTNNGVYVTSDHGATWMPANTGIETEYVDALTVEGGSIFAGTNNGVYSSSDKGAHWIQKNTGLANLSIISLASKGTTIFLGAADAVYKSNDYGAHWIMANAGINGNVYSFAFYAKTVFAGTYGNGLYRSENIGTTWTKVLGLPENAFIYSIKANENDLFAGTDSGVYKSTDGGTTWVLSNTGFTNSDAHAQDFAFTSGAILAGTYSEGVFRSTDRGATWTPVDNGLPNYTFNSGLPHNYPQTVTMITSGKNVLDGTSTGVFLTSDIGNHWKSSSNGLANTKVLALVGNFTAEFAGTDGDGVFSSSDNGQTWVPKRDGLGSFIITALGKGMETIFAGTADQGIYSSDNNGTSWKPITGTSGSAHAFVAKGNSVFAGVTPNGPYFQGEIYRLTHADSGWTATALNFPHPVLTLALKGDSLFAGTSDGEIYASANDGSTWTNMSAGLSTSPVTSIVIVHKVLYASTSGSGVFKSSNNGATWTSAGNIGLADLNVNDLKSQSTTLFAGTQDKGVFRSDDGGAHWTNQNGNLKYLSINVLDIRGTHLLAGTRAAVWFRNSGVVNHNNSLARKSNDTPRLEEITEHTTLVYPNPAIDQLTIEITQGSDSKISIIDIGGKVIYSDSGITAGSKKEINVSNFNRGFYLLKVENGNGVTLKKFVLQ